MSTQKAELVVSKLSNFRQKNKRFIQIPEIKQLAITGARCDHVCDRQTGVVLFRVVHPRILGLARRIRDGDKDVWASAPHLGEREDYGYEERQNARGHVCSAVARIEYLVVQRINAVHGGLSWGGLSKYVNGSGSTLER